MDYIKKYQKGNWLNKRIYEAVDPTVDYPTFLEAGKLGAYAAIGKKANKKLEPVSDAAWRKRLGLEYDSNLLPENPDGSFRLPESYEKQFMVNPSEVEKRIKRLIDIYGSREELEKYDHDNQMLLKRNEEYLEKLKKLYSGTPIVVNEFDVWKDTDIRNKEAISPFNVLKNFTLKYDPKTKIMTYEDVYDFNEFEKFVPGKAFNIRGVVPLKKWGGSISFKKGGIYIKPSKRGTFTAEAKKRGLGVQEFASRVMANKENYSPAMVKKANFAKNASKWKHQAGGIFKDYSDYPDITLSRETIKTLNLDKDPKKRPLLSYEVDQYNKYDHYILDAAKETGQDPRLIKAMLLKESGGYKQKHKNKKGYSGYAQTNQTSINSVNKNMGTTFTLKDMDNLKDAARYVGYKLNYIDRHFSPTNVSEKLIGYNYGPSRIATYRELGVLPKETQDYINDIHIISGGIVKETPAYLDTYVAKDRAPKSLKDFLSNLGFDKKL